MKLIKLSEEHYIICDDSEIKKGDWVVSGTKTIVQCMYPENVHHRDVKKITHSTQPLEDVGLNTSMGCQLGFDKIEPLYLSEVNELLGVVDVEKIAFAQFGGSQDNKTMDAFTDGYKQALKDNKHKKYTREDLLDAFTWGFMEGTERGNVTDSVNKFSQSLQPKTEWNVEIIEGKLKLV